MACYCNVSLLIIFVGQCDQLNIYMFLCKYIEILPVQTSNVFILLKAHYNINVIIE